MNFVTATTRLFCLLAVASAALAQNTGEIGGTVADPAGLTVAGAAVRLSNAGTGESREQVSNHEGYFRFPNLLPGQYSVRVSAPGFTDVLLSGVTLDVGQSLRLTPRLQPATVKTTVEVQGEAPVVNTSSASLSQVVDGKRVEQLPLNGRNALQLINLAPGVVTIGTSGQYGAVQSTFNIAGGRDIDVNYTLDGGIHVNPFYDIAVEYPNPDALAEFNVNPRNYSAAFGRGVSSVNAVTKSGSNQIRGDFFEFLRNTNLDSRPFFAAQRSIFKRNQFGGVIGGPIRKDRIFFFAAYQGTKQRGTPGDSSYQTLTDLERSGDFSDTKTIKDPLTNTAFPGNAIPASRIDPFALKFLSQLLPRANSAGNFYRFTPRSQLDQNQITAKIDYLITSRDHLWFRDYYDSIPQVSGNFLAAGNLTNFPTLLQNFTLGHTHTFTPHLVNELRATYVRSAFEVHPVTPWSLEALGLPLPAANATTEHGLSSESAIAVTGYFSGNEGAPTRDIASVIQFSDTLSWSAGIHQFSFGFDLYRNRLNEIQNFNTGGNITYSGQSTGVAAADFMLGKFSQLVYTSGFSARLRQTLPALYAQDDIRLSRRLTLNAGLRWDPFLPYTSENHALATLSPGSQSKVYPNAPVGLLYPGDAGVPENIIGNTWNNFAPRAGLAWDVFGTGHTSVRVGYGLYFIPLTRSTSYNRFAIMQPFAASVTISGGDTRNIFAAAPFNGVNPLVRTYASDPAVLATLPFLPTANETGLIRPFRTQTDQQWSLTLEQAVGSRNALRISYVGSASAHLFTTFEANPAVYIPGASTTSNTQQRRLYPTIGSINAAASALSANYNSLQATFTRHYATGLTLLSSFTWSKALGVNGAQKEGSNGPRDPYNWNLDYGPLPFDATRSFKTSAVWDLPWGSRLSSRALRLAAGGWQLSGILTAQTGFPFTVTSGVDNSLTGIGSDTANLIGDWRISGDRSLAAQIQQWFNPKAFTTNPVGTYGTVGINSLRAPGLLALDLSATKTIAVTERWRLEWRASFYNAPNHPMLGAPNAKANSSTLGQITTSGNPRVIELAMKLRF